MKRIKKLQLETRVIRSLTTELERVRGGSQRTATMSVGNPQESSTNQKSNSNNRECSGGGWPP
jgi:hypothetical protein